MTTDIVLHFYARRLLYCNKDLCKDVIYITSYQNAIFGPITMSRCTKLHFLCNIILKSDVSITIYLNYFFIKVQQTIPLKKIRIMSGFTGLILVPGLIMINSLAHVIPNKTIQSEINR